MKPAARRIGRIDRRIALAVAMMVVGSVLTVLGFFMLNWPGRESLGWVFIFFFGGVSSAGDLWYRRMRPSSPKEIGGSLFDLSMDELGG